WATLVTRASRTQLRDPSQPTGTPVVLGVRATSLQPILARLGTDLATAQGATTFTITPLGGALHVHGRVQMVDRTWAPNVVAVLTGSDPKLKHEYIVFSGHMDHIGVAGRGSGQCQAQGADSIC